MSLFIFVLSLNDKQVIERCTHANKFCAVMNLYFGKVEGLQFNISNKISFTNIQV